MPHLLQWIAYTLLAGDIYVILHCWVLVVLLQSLCTRYFLKSFCWVLGALQSRCRCWMLFHQDRLLLSKCAGPFISGLMGGGAVAMVDLSLRPAGHHNTHKLTAAPFLCYHAFSCLAKQVRHGTTNQQRVIASQFGNLALLLSSATGLVSIHHTQTRTTWLCIQPS